MPRIVRAENSGEILDLILQLLKEQSKTQKALCEHVGINPTVVTRWKTGEATSYMQHITRIAGFLGVSPDYLLGARNEKTSEGSFTDREIGLIQAFRKLDYPRQEHILRAMEYMHTPSDKC